MADSYLDVLMRLMGQSTPVAPARPAGQEGYTGPFDPVLPEWRQQLIEAQIRNLGGRGPEPVGPDVPFSGNTPHDPASPWSPHHANTPQSEQIGGRRGGPVPANAEPYTYHPTMESPTPNQAYRGPMTPGMNMTRFGGFVPDILQVLQMLLSPAQQEAVNTAPQQGLQWLDLWLQQNAPRVLQAANTPGFPLVPPREWGPNYVGGGR